MSRMAGDVDDEVLGSGAGTGSGSIDPIDAYFDGIDEQVERLSGTVLKPRKLVGVRGAGLAYDGLYYVKSVTHKIKAGEYKQSFELSRNGLISTLPRVAA